MKYITGYFDDDDVEFYFEVGDDDGVKRQVERVRSTGAFEAAASLEEWADALQSGHVADYQARFGGIADGAVSQWDPDAPLSDISKSAFEALWQDARAELGEQE